MMRERLRALVAVVAALALVLVAWGVNGLNALESGPSNRGSLHLPRVGPVGDGYYSHPDEVATGNGTYRFMFVTSADGAPVTWEPCLPISLVVNPEGGPPDAVEMVEQAAAEISASSIDIAVTGETDERPSAHRTVSTPRYPGGWAPALVAWSDTEESPHLKGPTIGHASPDWGTLGGRGHWVTGQVVLEADYFTQMDEDGRGDVAATVVLHELGHLLGLDHVSDPGEVMYPNNGFELTRLGPGDRAGLAALGAGRCSSP
jgi:hypothetical protein